MRYMHWSYSDLQACPADVVREIVAVMNEASAAAEADDAG